MSLDGGARQLVLLVEDNRADILMIQDAMKRHRLTRVDLHIVSDGDQAYEFIERAENDPDGASCPDLIILDLNLPRRSGREILKRLRQSTRCSAVPVVIVSSSDLLKDRRELSALGATRYFCKPFGYEEFLAVGAIFKELLEDPALNGGARQ